jgi:hypothetical protein
MKRGVVSFVFAFVLGVSGLATAGILSAGGSHSPAPSDRDETNEQDTGVHGGPIERFHQTGACSLTEVSALPGNWTHGDYVSAVAAAGDPTLIRQAAWSDCGKPMVSVGHGGGPPAHALKQIAAGQAHAGGEPDAEGSIGS